MALNVSSERRGDVLVLALTGELDIYTVPSFRETVDRLAKDEPGIMLDLEAVSLIDSSGLGALVSLANQVGERDGQLGLLCPQQSLRRVFEITGLRRAFTFGTTFDELTAAMDRTREGTSNPA
ncbi:MAG: STAS domain-containing protein [Actinobacteria bacterium]|nr:STAS domain-containing protein [Thermoleophilia bacterium]MCB9011954.1 STAS domain-containing protein [Actinomycetota bacterium]